MPARNPLHGMSRPSLGQCVMAAATVCAAWIIWTESRDRGWIPGLAGPAADSVDQNRAPDANKPRAPVGVAPLVADLSNDLNPNARREALLKLSSIGPEAIEAIEAIRERLKDEESGVRHVALLALWRVSQDPDLVLPEIPALLADENSGVRGLAADTLESVGPPATELAIKLLRDDSPAVRSRMLLVLQRIVCPATFSQVSEAIESLFQDSNTNVRAEALAAFVDWGMIDHAGIRDLLRTDHIVAGVRPRIDPERNSRQIALQAITWLGLEAADLVPDLIAMLEEFPEWEITASRNDQGRQVQYQTLAPGVSSILRTLGSLKTVARPSIPYLLGRLNDLEGYGRQTVVDTLVDIGAEREVLTPLLIARLSGPDLWAGFRAGKWLVVADPAEARRQVALLIPKLSNPMLPWEEFPWQALKGLALDAKEAVPPLISLLSDQRAWAAHAANDILGEIGPDAAPAVSRLVAILEQRRAQGEIERYASTIETLGKIGPAAESAVSLLLAILNDPTEPEPPPYLTRPGDRKTYYESTILALGKIAIDSPKVRSAIRRHLSNDAPDCRAIAVHALGLSVEDAPQVLAEIIEILQNDAEGYVRAHAAMAIATLSSDRQQALEPLTEALGDSHVDVRKMAATALKSLGAAAKNSLPALRQALLDARCGIPRSQPPSSFRKSNVLARDNQEIRSLPLVQTLLKAISEIERAD